MLTSLVRSRQELVERCGHAYCIWMRRGRELAWPAAAVLGCSWSPVTVSIATVTPLASPHSAAWRLNSVSACLTKLVHCKSRIEAPLRGFGMVATGVGFDCGPHEMRISGKAIVATATPAVWRNFRRDQPVLAFFLAFAMTGTPLVADSNWDALENPILTLAR